MNRPRLHIALNTLFRVGALVTLCIAPTQWALELRPTFFLSPADLTLAFTAGVWLLDIFITREWCRLRPLPPWPNLLFVALAFASALTAPDRMAALKDLIQFTEYFLVGHLVFAAFLRDTPRAARQALAVLTAVTALCLGLALVHYFNPDFVDLKVRGTFGNRNVLGGFLSLALPLVFGAALGVRPLWGKCLLVLLLVAGFTVNLSGAAFFAVAGVMACMAAARGPKLFIPVAALLLAWQVFVLPRLPRENDLAHFQSLALVDGAGAVERRYPDWQAAYSMALTHPWLGVGLGNYQKHVGQYYGNIPRQTGPSEPDIQNLYLVLAASAGLPALLAFFALLGCALQAAKTTGAVTCSTLSTALSHGTAGAITAFALTSVWHPLLVRGIGLPLVFMLALAYHLNRHEVADGI
jgi:O-antigen ligase